MAVELPRTEWVRTTAERDVEAVAAMPPLRDQRAAQTALKFWLTRMTRLLREGFPPGHVSVETARLRCERALNFLHEGRP